MESSTHFEPHAELPIEHLTALNVARLTQLSEDARLRGRQVVDLALLGLRSLLLLNGGAVVSLFTVLGHLSDLTIAQVRLWVAFGSYAFGLVAVLLATLLGFLAENEFMQEDFLRAARTYFEAAGMQPRSDISYRVVEGKRMWTIAVIFAVLSLGLFVLGSGFALSAVQLKVAPPAPAHQQSTATATHQHP